MRQGIMETLRFQAEARRKLIDAAMLEASEKMDKLYSLKGYPEILNRFAHEALSDPGAFAASRARDHPAL